MTAYRLYGAQTSPYSLKVRACLRYKNVGFEWIGRSAGTEEEFRSLARAPTVPLLVFPNRPASQDSTLMLAALEADIPEPSATPEDPACQAIATVLEDYADEWLNKAMFQQRWGQMPDRAAAASRLLVQLFGRNVPKDRQKVERQISSRMMDRLALVGAAEENKTILKSSFHRFARLLNEHLKAHLFVFGGKPSVADFALAAQLQQLLMDPTPGDWLRDRAPFVTAWCEFMQDPKVGGPYKSLDEVGETLLPLLRDEVAKTFLPWAAANGASASRRRRKFSVTLEDGIFEQSTQRFAAKSFKDVKKKVEKVARASEPLEKFLEAAGVKTFLL